MMTAEELAKKFSSELVKEIGEFKVCEVNKRNYKQFVKTKSWTGVCHTHDFCDANEVMARVVKDVDEQTFDLINEAWTLAKQNNFYL